MKGLKSYIKLDFIIDIKNYRESFNKWLKVRGKYHQTDPTGIEEAFDRYLSVIKPVMHHFDQVINRFPETGYGFFTTDLNGKQVQILKNVFDPLKKYDILCEQPKETLTNEECERILEKKHEQIFRIEVLQNPVNDELKWWGNGLDVEEVSFQSNVVKGKGEGRKSLGMPTANIEVEGEIEKQLADYPNGVYLVDFTFQGGRTYSGAGCLGTNPHYQNFQQSRRVEVYVLHDFGEDLFYGENVRITLKRLIRFEGKFSTFDSFLQAMHNDIYVARHHKQ